MSVSPYSPRAGDVLYKIPVPSAFGFVFSRGIAPGGASLPSAVLLRSNRAYQLRPASAYGVVNATYVSADPIDSRHGMTEPDFCYFVGTAWATHQNAILGTGAAGVAPSKLAVGAVTWGWVRA